VRDALEGAGDAAHRHEHRRGEGGRGAEVPAAQRRSGGEPAAQGHQLVDAVVGVDLERQHGVVGDARQHGASGQHAIPADRRVVDHRIETARSPDQQHEHDAVHGDSG
jgi:exoribonuclease R